MTYDRKFDIKEKLIRSWSRGDFMNQGQYKIEGLIFFLKIFYIKNSCFSQRNLASQQDIRRDKIECFDQN